MISATFMFFAPGGLIKANYSSPGAAEIREITYPGAPPATHAQLRPWRVAVAFTYSHITDSLVHHPLSY
jgi:hypothetical protein